MISHQARMSKVFDPHSQSGKSKVAVADTVGKMESLAVLRRRAGEGGPSGPHLNFTILQHIAGKRSLPVDTGNKYALQHI